MSSPLLIAIAGLPISFALDHSALRRQIQVRYRGYLAPGGRPTLSFTCSVTKKALSRRRRARVHREAGVTVLERRDFRCTFSGYRGEILLHPSIYAFDALLRVLLATALPVRGALLLHSSGVDRGCRGAVFTGRSGAGKTTIARLAGGRILNDEIVALSTRNGRAFVSGTPFWGDMGTGPARGNPVPLHGIHFLKKAKKDSLQTVSLPDALPRLLRCVCFFGRGKEEVGEVLTTAIQIMGLVPAWELRFSLSRRFMTLVWK